MKGWAAGHLLLVMDSKVNSERCLGRCCRMASPKQVAGLPLSADDSIADDSDAQVPDTSIDMADPVAAHGLAEPREPRP